MSGEKEPIEFNAITNAYILNREKKPHDLITDIYKNMKPYILNLGRFDAD